MAVRSLGTLTLDLVAKTGGYVGGLSKAERESAKFKAKIRREFQDVSRIVGRSLAIASTAAVAGTVAIFRSTGAAIDAQAKFADSVGVTTEALAGLELAAEINGASQESLRKGFERLVVNLNDFKNGIGEARGAFERLGISIDDVSDRSPEEIFGLIGDSLNKIPNQAERAALAYEIFGRQGIKLIKTLENGSEGLRDFRDEAERLGLAVSRVDAAKVEAANDALTRAQAVFKGASRVLTVELAPAVEELANSLSDPNTLAAVQAIGKAIISTMNGAIRVIKDTIGVTQFLAEELAAIRVGINEDDIIRLEDEADKIREILEGGIIAFGEKIRFFGPDGIVEFKSDAELRAELAKIEGAIESYYSKPPNKPKVPIEISNTGSVGAPIVTGVTPPPAAPITTNNDAEKYIADLEKQVELLGKSAIEQALYNKALENATPAQKAEAEALLKTVEAYEQRIESQRKSSEAIARINEDALSIQASLRTEEEAIEESYQRRREIILQNTQVTGEAQKELLKRLDDDRIKQLEGVGDGVSVFAEQAARNIQDSLGNAINDLISGTEEWERTFIKSLLNIISQAAAADLAASLGLPGSGSGGNLSGLVSVVGGFFGQAHDGLMSVPKTGTYLLEKGERVTTERTSAKLDQTLAQVQSKTETQQQPNLNVNAVTVLDANSIAGVLSSPELGSTFINQARINRSEFRAALGINT